MKIHTLGYSGWKTEDIKALVERVNGVLVDVRIVARSRNVHFNSGTLASVFGDRYRWLREFGNRNYKTNGPIDLVDFDDGAAKLQPLIDAGQTVILMCGCADVNVCHRKHVAQRLAELFGADVEHLPTPPKPEKKPGEGLLF